MAATRPIQILIADDHALFRRGLRHVLDDAPDLVVVGEAADGAEAVELAVATSPDVVLMDIRMPRMSGIEATAEILNERPKTKIVMLTVSEEAEDLLASLRAGACGYLLKEVAIDEIAAAVRGVTRGLALISPSVAPSLIRAYRELAENVRTPNDARFAAPVLTPREVSVLELIAEGHSNREIAARLFVAENTVKNHVRNVLEKLHVHSRTEAVLFAVRERLIVDPAKPRGG